MRDHRVTGLLLLLLLLGGTACTRYPNATPPPSALHPPIYPGAQQVQTRATSRGSPGEETIFLSPDVAEKIAAFYSVTLLNDKWTRCGSETPTANQAEYCWSEGCPGYSLTLTIKSITDGLTQVKLEWVVLGCE
jgi:hypothetical protein